VAVATRKVKRKGEKMNWPEPWLIVLIFGSAFFMVVFGFSTDANPLLNDTISAQLCTSYDAQPDGLAFVRNQRGHATGFVLACLTPDNLTVWMRFDKKNEEWPQTSDVVK
jgi:hypothetical protein